jgi:pantothenate kinase
MIALTVAQLAFLTALQHSARKLYFAGSFIRNTPYILAEITSSQRILLYRQKCRKCLSAKKIQLFLAIQTDTKSGPHLVCRPLHVT